MGKHKDPEVSDEAGRSDRASDQAADETSGKTAQDAGGTSRGGRRAKGSERGKSQAATGNAGEKRAEKPVEETAGAPDSPEEETQAGTRRDAEDDTGGRSEHGAGHEDEHDRAGPHAEELAYHDEAMSDLADQVVEERSHRTLYATLFFVLLGIVVVAGLTLWAAPKVAPHVPGVIAQYLVPGQVATGERVDALEQRLAEQTSETDSEIAALRDRLENLSVEVEAAGASEETEAAISDARHAADAAAESVAALSERLDGLEARLAGMREEVSAVSETLTGAGEGAAPPELAAAINSLRERVDQLAGAVEGGPPTAELAEQLRSLTARLEELGGNLAAAREAESEVSTAIRETRLQSAFDTLSGRLAAGQPYAAALSEIAGLSGTEPPEALAAAAETGVPSATELEATFGRHAQEAISADIRVQSGENALGEALGWLRAQVAGRPVSEQEGDSVPAITSRIAARLEESRLEAALEEAGSLPAHAQEALGGWLERLRARVEAERALAAWRDQVVAKG